jgi:hypothetical protein
MNTINKILIKKQAMDIDEDSLDAGLYDFSGDDFANDKEIQKLRKEEAEFNKMMNDSIKIVAEAFNAKKSSHKNLKHFLLHRSVSIPYVTDSYLGRWKNRDIYFCVFEYESSVHAGRLHSSGSNYYFAGLIELDKTYPHTLAQPETIAIKLENLVTKLDIDFKYAKKFSRKFHVITKDEHLLEMLFMNKDLDQLANHPSAEFELKDRQCYFRANRKPVSLAEAEKFVELAKTFLEVI